MEHIHMPQGRPLVAIVDSNTLATLGLKQILQNVMPIMTVETSAPLLSWKLTNQISMFIILWLWTLSYRRDNSSKKDGVRQ